MGDGIDPTGSAGQTIDPTIAEGWIRAYAKRLSDSGRVEAAKQLLAGCTDAAKFVAKYRAMVGSTQPARTTLQRAAFIGGVRDGLKLVQYLNRVMVTPTAELWMHYQNGGPTQADLSRLAGTALKEGISRVTRGG